MMKAKEAISKFTGNHGHHTDETVNSKPAVVNEAVKPHQHESVTHAVDREVHKDHHHTTVQPISHQEVLPEKHHHNMMPTEHREYRHGDEDATQARLSKEQSQFKDTSTTHETTFSQETAPTVTGEHVHHHVHETIQPVIHQETIQPHVVHTTKPIHETHHLPAEHHGISTLQTMSLDEFKKGGGIAGVTGARNHEEYEGRPRPHTDKYSSKHNIPGIDHNTTNNERLLNEGRV